MRGHARSTCRVHYDVAWCAGGEHGVVLLNHRTFRVRPMYWRMASLDGIELTFPKNLPCYLLLPISLGRRQVWGRVVGERVRRSCGHSLKRRNCDVDLRDLCRRLEMWVEWGQTVVRKGAYVDMSQGAEAVAVEIAKIMAYLFFARKTKMSTVAGKLVAVQSLTAGRGSNCR